MNYVNDSPNNWLILREERSLKDSVWKWASPELLDERIPSFKSDLFSFCCIIWEIYHRMIPWKDVTLQQVKSKYQKGETLNVTSPDLMKILKMQLISGLNPREQQRNLDLEEIRMTLVKESVKTFVERGTDSQTDLPTMGMSDTLRNDSQFPANLVFDIEDRSEVLIPEFDTTASTNRRRSTIHFIDVNSNKSADTGNEPVAGEENAEMSKVERAAENNRGQSENVEVFGDTTEMLSESKAEANEKNSKTIMPGNEDHENQRVQRKNSKKAGSVRELIKVFEGL